MNLPPLPDPNKRFFGQDPEVLLAMCIWGEARNQSYDAKVGVGCVVRNRAQRNLRYMGGSSYSGVILQPYQFSSFNANDPNRDKLLRPLMHEPQSVWAECYRAAVAVYRENCADVTGGALFYFSPPLTEAPHAWGSVMFTAKIQDLEFYKPSPVVQALAA